MSNAIVTVNVSQDVAPAPSELQRTGALISQGATTTAVGAKSLLTELADLTPLLKGALGITGITQSAGVATAVTAAVHGLPIGDPILLTIAGSTVAGYNGTFVCTPTTTTHFTYAVAAGTASPATGTIVYTPEDVAELLAMATSFFAQGAQLSVYVLEMGIGNATDGVTFLTAWIAANPNVFYSYLVPRYWDGNASYLTFLATFLALSAKTYFFTTATLQNYGLYAGTLKCCIAMVEAPVYGVHGANVLTAIAYDTGVVTAATTTAHGVLPGQYFTLGGTTPVGYNGTFLALPGTAGTALIYNLPADPGAETVLGTLVASYYASTGIPSTEFSLAQPFWVSLSYAPSTTNKVTPFPFSFLFGDTPFPTQGNGAVLQSLKTAAINYVGTGAEGGISTSILKWGTTKDGRPFQYWYAVDWMQINAALAIANEVINGSNNPINPLYYNVQGISRLQARLAGVASNAVTFGLANGTVNQTELDGPALVAAMNAGTFAGQLIVNAVPFIPYCRANPSDYALGQYNGLSMVFVPQNGFSAIIININVSDFVTQ